MTQASVPESLLDFTKCSCKTECQTKQCSCKQCSCKKGDICIAIGLCDNEICLKRLEYCVSSDSQDDQNTE